MNARIILFLCLSLMVSSLAAQRESKTINHGWKFYKGDIQEAQQPRFNDENWEKVSLPHTWNTDAYTHKDYYKGIGWYRKQIQLPSSWENKQLFLKFEAASKAVSVYINGHLLGEHRGGYTAFTFDITPYCNFASTNTIAVSVDNSRQDIPPISGDFTFFGGIYRDAWLIAVPKQHISLTNLSSDGVFIETPEVSEKEASLVIRGQIENHESTPVQMLLEHTIYRPDGSLLETIKKPIRLAAKASHTFRHHAKAVQSPSLWSPESPNLYRVETVLRKAKTKEILDQIQQYTGFRWYRFDGKEGFFLNGKPYKLRGMCRHQDQKPIGVALTDEMHRRDMLLMKEMGVNFLRISHYPQDAAILEQCDKLGILAWEEIPVIDIVPDTKGYAEACEQNLREMIRQHYNHPSVITWGYMNEILLVTLRRYKDPEKLNPILERTIALTKHLEKVAREEDSYRVTTIAFHGSNAYNEYGLGDITNVIGWNLYSGWYGGDLTGFDRFLERQQKDYPDHPVIVSEYGAGSDKRLHSLQPKSFDFSIEYQQKYLEHYLPVIEEKKYVSGGTHWNFIDFSSALRDESMPRINNKGLVYADRTPKDVFYYYKAMFREDIPVLHIASRDWNRRAGVQKEGNPVIQPVKVYTNLSSVELFLNGKSLGIKNVSNCFAVFHVPFATEQNVLRAVGQKAGQYIEDGTTITFNFIPETLTEKNMLGVELAINVGSNCFYTSPESHLTWLPDQPYQPGKWGYLTADGDKEKNQEVSTQTEIHLTPDNPLFQTLRVNPVGYRFDVPQGTYELELLFADIFKQQEDLVYQLGQPSVGASQGNKFHIYVNNNKIEDSFTPSQESGYFQAVRKKIMVIVRDNNGLLINFETANGKSFLNGLKLRRL